MATSLVSSIDQLESKFTHIEQDLGYVSHKLEQEFTSTYGSDNTNPLKLLKKIKQLQEQIPGLHKECHDVMAAKQSLMSTAHKVAMAQRLKLQQLHKRAGATPTGEGPFAPHLDDYAVQFSETLQEWHKQVGEYFVVDKPEAYHHEGLLTSEDLNLELLRTGAAKKMEGVTAKDEGIVEADDIEDGVGVEDKENAPGQYEPSAAERRALGEFVPVTEEEFAALPASTRGRCKLADVNKVYTTLYGHFSELKRRDRKALNPKQMTAMGLKVVGQTGEHKLACLRSLRLIKMSRQGVLID